MKASFFKDILSNLLNLYKEKIVEIFHFVPSIGWLGRKFQGGKMWSLSKNLEKHHHEAKGPSYYYKNKEKVCGDVNIVEPWMQQLGWSSHMVLG